MFDEPIRRERGRGESGFALILAIMALLLLTFLGLTMATTSSTEFQIAFNYQASQQALYNAEAGVEVAKGLLRTMTTPPPNPDWSVILPGGRAAGWNGTSTPAVAGGGAVAAYSRPDQWGNPSRNFENWQCDKKGNGMGYGVVLDDGSAAAPYQNKTTVFGQSLGAGAFTIWVRRPLSYNPDATLIDYNTDNNNLILVAEGVSPFDPGGRRRSAVQVIEVSLALGPPTNTACGAAWAQSGGGALGANAANCIGLDPLTGGSALIGAMGQTAGQAGMGTGARLP